MSSTLQQLTKKRLINPPQWLPNAIQYECVMGSIAYGVAKDSSDYDIYGFCIPKKEMVFPHLSGEILGFGRQVKRFEQYQEHHIHDKDALGGRGREYDFQIFNIVKYFQLLMENNPNMVDSLFVPRECILFTTKIGELVRESRTIFLNKKSYHTFKGYAFSQLSKAHNSQRSHEIIDILQFETEHRIPHTTSYNDAKNRHSLGPQLLQEYLQLWQNGFDKTKRFEIQKICGMDTKFCYHILRLCDECDQILSTGDLNLQRSKEQMKAIRNGEWTLEQIKGWFAEQEKTLEQLYRDSKLPHTPDEAKIKVLLLKCLEEYFGSLDKCIYNTTKEQEILKQIKMLVENI